MITCCFLVPQITNASWVVIRKSDGEIRSWDRRAQPPGCDCDTENGTETMLELPGEQEVDLRLHKYDFSSNQVVNKNIGEIESYDLKKKAVRHNSMFPFLSSQRYKENIQTAVLDTTNFMKLQPKTFTWKGDGTSDMGFIAEEVAELIPDLVVKNEDGTIEGVRYDRIPLYLFEVVKQHTSRLDALDGGLSSIATSTTAEGPDNAWSVDQQSGKVNVNFFGDINMQGNAIRDVTSISGMFNKWKIDGDGILTAVKVVSDSLNVKDSVEFGSAEKPIGVTFYDESNGQPYCFKVVNGAAVAMAGKCSSSGASSGSGSAESTASTTSESSE